MLSLTHWGRVTHICVGNLTIIGSDNGTSPGRRQAIIWNNAGILLIGPLGANFSEILIEIHAFSFTKMLLKMSSGKWRPFCHGLNMSGTATNITPGATGTCFNIWCLEPARRFCLKSTQLDSVFDRLKNVCIATETTYFIDKVLPCHHENITNCQ